jgi:hypothetical protein
MRGGAMSYFDQFLRSSKEKKMLTVKEFLYHKAKHHNLKKESKTPTPVASLQHQIPFFVLKLISDSFLFKSTSDSIPKKNISYNQHIIKSSNRRT